MKGRILVAVAALTSALSTGPMSTAGATPIPVILDNPAECVGANGQPMNVTGPEHNLYTCRFAIDPSGWTNTGDGSWVMTNIQWSSWGAYEATGTARVGFRSCWGSCNNDTFFKADVTFSFPVTWDGHLVYAFFSAAPSNRALAKKEVGNGSYYEEGFAL